jgi:hypothetical protein
VAWFCQPLRAGTDANGFFDEFLTAVAYNGPGCDPGGERTFDSLCDGAVSEDDIVPEDGLVLGPPVMDPGDCTGSSTPTLRGFHANALLDLDGNLPIVRTPTAGDLLDFDALSGAADNVVGYAWAYVNNVSGGSLNAVLAIASDDAISVEINRAEVLGLNGGAYCRGFGAAGTIQDRIAVSLPPGGNLFQVKVWDGCCGWGFRLRLEDPVNCAPFRSGEGEIEVGTDLIPLFSSPASRTITAMGTPPAMVTANITVAVDNGGAAYNLQENFDAGWAASMVTPAATASGAGFLRWTGITAASVSYRLTRTGDFSTRQAQVAGTATLGGVPSAVVGDSEIPGGIAVYVAEVLVGASQVIIDAAGPDTGSHGCNMTPMDIDGAWMVGEDNVTGDSFTDATIVPYEGMNVSLDFAASLSGGISAGHSGAAEVAFGLDPANPESAFNLVRATSTDGFYDWQRGDIYGADINDTMNVAYFYALNSAAVARRVIVGFGSDDAGGVRVNGRPAHTIPACRGHPGFADKFFAHLDPGKNLIAVYTFENGGGYNMCIRFEDENFDPIAVRTTLDPAGYNPAAHPDPGPLPSIGVARVLVTASFNIGGGVNGCTVSAPAIRGNWITGMDGDGNPVTDANIVPRAGLVLRPDYNRAAQSNGLTNIDAGAQTRFWTVPGDPIASGSILVPVSGSSGFFDWQRGDIYASDPNVTMNVAYFYAINDGATPQCVQIGFGSDDSGGVRVNGRPTLAVPACRPHNAFTDKFLAQLDPGKNLIAVYTYENGGGYNMCIRFEDPATGRVLSSVPTTLDPTGYDPSAHPEPDPSCRSGVIEPAAYIRQGVGRGLVTQYLVNANPIDQNFSGSGATSPSALPEDYISIEGGPADVTNVFEGAVVMAGSTGMITTGVRGNPCGFTTLVKFDGFVDGTPTDPSLFNGETFYRNQDTYSASLFFFVNNISGGELDGWFGFDSDDGASLYVNGELIVEYTPARGYAGSNILQSFATRPAILDTGANLVQLSYLEGIGGSGARVGLFNSGCFNEAFSEAEVEVSANPPGFTAPPVTASRTLTRIDCAGNANATLTFSVAGGGMASAMLREELPLDVVGSNPSLGSFNPGGSVLTFNGMVSDGQTLTYRVAGADPGDAYCTSTVNDILITGDSAFRLGTDVCDDLVDGEIYVNCGGPEYIDLAGRVWLEDSTANPSRFLTSGNIFTANFGALGGVDTLSDPFIAAEGYEEPIFPDERWDDGDIEYTFSALPRGNYQVALLFMEGCCSDGCEDIPDPAASAGGCRVFDIYINGTLIADQYSQNVAAARAAMVPPGALANRIAVAVVSEARNVDSLQIRIDDLGGGNPPENASIKAICIKFTGQAGTLFVRGDADRNGRIELTDAVRILNFLFLGIGTLPCLDAADADDNGRHELTDAVRVLNYLFLGTGRIPEPDPSTADYVTADCGLDPTETDEFDCAMTSMDCGG